MGRDHSYECETCGEMRGGFDDVPCLCGAAPLVALGQYVPPNLSTPSNSSNPPAVPDGSPLPGTVADLIGLRIVDPPRSFDQTRLDRSMRNLAQNLAVAGGLCAAFELGIGLWEPNTAGRPAPGWGGRE